LLVEVAQLVAEFGEVAGAEGFQRSLIGLARGAGGFA
jgi:hypothetical protein